MKVRTRNPDGDKIETQMAAMIDVVFQLLIFFMLTLKIIEPEGDFDINMPLGAPASSASTPDLPPLKVRMEADADGQLIRLTFNGRDLRNGPEAFQRLNMEVLKSVNALRSAGPANVDKQEVEIDPDYNLDYKNIISAISACSGKMDNGKMIRYISRIKFAPIRQPN